MYGNRRSHWIAKLLVWAYVFMWAYGCSLQVHGVPGVSSCRVIPEYPNVREMQESASGNGALGQKGLTEIWWLAPL